MQKAEAKQPVCRSCGKSVKTEGIFLCGTCTKAQGWEIPTNLKVRPNPNINSQFAPFEPDREYLEQVEKWCQEAVANSGLPVEPDKLYVTREGYEVFKKHWSNLLKERGWPEDAIQFVDDLVPTENATKEVER